MKILLPVCFLFVFSAACGGDDASFAEQDRLDVAETVAAFVTAYGNGDGEQLSTFWSDECTAEEIAASAGSSQLLASLLSLGTQGSIDVELNAEMLAIEVDDAEHVTIPLEQPDGAVETTSTVSDAEIPGLGVLEGGSAPLTQRLLVERPLELVKEDGSWKVRTCVPVLNDEDTDHPYVPDASDILD